MNHRLNAWLRLGCLAPSGGNLQPWQFRGERVGSEDQIRLSLSEEFLAAPPHLDPTLMTGAIALGAFAKNVEIAARTDGYRLSEIRAEGAAPKEWAWTLSFVPDAAPSGEEVLAVMAIEGRVTYRGPMRPEPLPQTTVADLQTLVAKYPLVTLTSVSRQRLEWGQLLSRLERIRCRNPILRQELFNELRTPSELRLKPVGLPLESATPFLSERVLLRLMKRFPALQFLLSSGVEWIFSHASSVTPLRRSGDAFLIQAVDPDPRTGFELGRFLEELWLRLYRAGFSVQPMALPLVVSGPPKVLTPAQLAVIDRARVEAREKLDTDLSLPSLLVRTGLALRNAPSSPRLLPRVE